MSVGRTAEDPADGGPVPEMMELGPPPAGNPAASRAVVAYPPRVAARSVAPAVPDESGYAVAGSDVPSGVPQAAPATSANSQESGSAGSPEAGGDPSALPLYRRMQILRQSPFAAASAKAATDSSAEAAPRPGAARPTPLTPAERAALSNPSDTDRAPVALEAPPGVHSNGPTPVLTSNSPASVISSTGPTPAPVGPADVTAPGAKPLPNVLLSRQSPNLSVETAGPRKIVVGHEAAYQVTVSNSAEVVAEELIVTMDLPAWAEVSGAEVSSGTSEVPAAAAPSHQVLCAWRLEAKGRERLRLRIIPRESRPIDLSVRWDYKQAGSQAVIEVQEPKLAIRLEGPRKVLYGHTETYKLRVSNTGTGDAENVVAKLWPLGLGDSASASHNFGTVGAGQDKWIEVELHRARPAP